MDSHELFKKAEEIADIGHQAHRQDRIQWLAISHGHDRYVEGRADADKEAARAWADGRTEELPLPARLRWMPEPGVLVLDRFGDDPAGAQVKLAEFHTIVFTDEVEIPAVDGPDNRASDQDAIDDLTTKVQEMAGLLADKWVAEQPVNADFVSYPPDHPMHQHDTDAGGNCRNDACDYNSDAAYFEDPDGQGGDPSHACGGPAAEPIVSESGEFGTVSLASSLADSGNFVPFTDYCTNCRHRTDDPDGPHALDCYRHEDSPENEDARDRVVQAIADAHNVPVEMIKSDIVSPPMQLPPVAHQITIPREMFDATPADVVDVLDSDDPCTQYQNDVPLSPAEDQAAGQQAYDEEVNWKTTPGLEPPADVTEFRTAQDHRVVRQGNGWWMVTDDGHLDAEAGSGWSIGDLRANEYPLQDEEPEPSGDWKTTPGLEPPADVTAIATTTGGRLERRGDGWWWTWDQAGNQLEEPYDEHETSGIGTPWGWGAFGPGPKDYPLTNLTPPVEIKVYSETFPVPQAGIHPPHSNLADQEPVGRYFYWRDPIYDLELNYFTEDVESHIYGRRWQSDNFCGVELVIDGRESFVGDVEVVAHAWRPGAGS